MVSLLCIGTALVRVGPMISCSGREPPNGKEGLGNLAERKPKGLIARYLREDLLPGPRARALQILRYIGPGLLVTVGFIDPGNWASNVSAGADYGYKLLWMITLSTLMLILLQHNAAHLGIATGNCLAESATIHLPRSVSTPVLGSAVLAAIATAYAELLGGAIALDMLFGIPLRVGALLALVFASIMLLTNSYKRIERWVIGFVSLIGLSFLVEMVLAPIDWGNAAVGWVTPSITIGSMPILMSVLGAVVMPHNLFLHSEVIQSRQWNQSDKKVMERRLKFEFLDTLFSMSVGWAINSAMILLAASTFFLSGIKVSELGQAQAMLAPLLGPASAVIFAIALLFSGLASSITAGMAGGSIFAGFFKEPYAAGDKHSRTGIFLALVPALLLIFVTGDPFKGLVLSQMVLSIQLPITVFLQIRLTSSRKVMGDYRNSRLSSVLLWTCAIVVSVLNLLLFKDLLAGFF